MINQNKLVYRVAEAIRKELGTMNAKVICEMAKDIGPHDMTPFNILAVSAIKEMKTANDDTIDFAAEYVSGIGHDTVRQVLSGVVIKELEGFCTIDEIFKQ